MSPSLAAVTREQSAMVQAALPQMGPLQSVSFKGVAPNGCDVYEVRFEHGHLEYGLALGTDGKFSTIFLRPPQ